MGGTADDGSPHLTGFLMLGCHLKRIAFNLVQIEGDTSWASYRQVPDAARIGPDHLRPVAGPVFLQTIIKCLRTIHSRFDPPKSRLCQGRVRPGWPQPRSA